MILRLVTAVLTLVACLGGMYGALALGSGGGETVSDDGGGSAKKGNGDGLTGGEVRTDFIAVPIVLPERIEGYIIGRYVIGVDPKVARKLGASAGAFLAHGVNAFFYANAQETFWLGGTVTVPKIADGLKVAINDAAGAPLVVDLAIRQLDFLETAEVRQPVISVDRQEPLGLQ